MRLSSSFLSGYRSNDRDSARLERVLAVGRAFLAVSGLTAIYLDPTEPARLADETYGVLAAYALYSLGVLVLVHGWTRLKPKHGLVLHGIDILWASLLTFVSEGPVSPFFLFFLFVTLEAAFRWGFRGTIATTVVTLAIFLLETELALASPWRDTWFAEIHVELNRTVLRVTYLLLTGFLLGYFAEQEKDLRSEMTAIAHATHELRVELGVSGSVAAVAERLLGIFDAAAVVFVLHDCERRRTTLWHLDRSEDDSDPKALHRSELTSERNAGWLFEDPGVAWHARQVSDIGEAEIRSIAPEVWPLRSCRAHLPPAVTMFRSFETVTALNFGLPDEWRGRLYLFNAAEMRNQERSLHFLETLGEHVTPALTNLFLMRRLRSRAGAAERARVARELHDGAIQALLGLELKVAALRRTEPANRVALDDQLNEVQQELRREVLALREMMQALRPVEMDSSEQLPDVLAGVVERFGRDTGMSARFVAAGGPSGLHPRTALEAVKIVQEALANVRKHSQARNVLVRLTRDNGTCRLVVEDDGRGFDFEGRFTGTELDMRRIGPAMIKERARMAGAQLEVDSAPGVGSRVELTFEAASHG